MSEPTTPWPAMADVYLRNLDRTEIRTLSVPCEPINEWLAITPAFGRDMYGNSFLAGRFTITHLPSGWDLGGGSACMACCRRAGWEIAALDLDWSVVTPENSRAWIADLPKETRSKLDAARALYYCGAMDCGADDPEGDDR